MWTRKGEGRDGGREEGLIVVPDEGRSPRSRSSRGVAVRARALRKSVHPAQYSATAHRDTGTLKICEAGGRYAKERERERKGAGSWEEGSRMADDGRRREKGRENEAGRENRL